MIEDLTGNIKRAINGLAQEIAIRVAVDPENSDGTPYNVEHHAKMVLIDWLLGDFIPGERK